jgi:hypothetical protein
VSRPRRSRVEFLREALVAFSALRPRGTNTLPNTAVDALTRFQQGSFEAIHVAQTAQLASLQAARELTIALSEVRPPFLTAGSALTKMNELTTAFTFTLLGQQVDYIKSLSDAFIGAASATAPVAVAAHAVIVAATAPELPSSAAALAAGPAPAPFAPPDAHEAVANDAEFFSKTLPAPPSARTPSGTAPIGKPQRMPIVSSNRMPRKRSGN